MTRRRIYYLLLGLLATLPLLAPAATDVRTAGLKGDGVTDETDALQRLLGQGSVELVFSRGVYLLGTVSVPSNVTLRGEAGARIRINPARITTADNQPATKTHFRCLFGLRGSNIELNGLEFDFTLTENGSGSSRERISTIISGDGISNVRLEKLIAERPAATDPIPLAERKREHWPDPPKGREPFDLGSFRDTQDIVMESCRATQLSNMLLVRQCARVWSLNNQAESCNSITCSLGGDEFLWHMGNRSRDVRHQCRWFGGNSNDHRKLQPGSVGLGTATMVARGSRDTDPDYNRFTAGVFDVFVINNTGEYGRTLAWGSKGREVVFKGNIGRFMNDYVLGSEGGENVTFDSNIVMNASTCGLASYYWGEKLVMTDNIIMVHDEPIDMNYSWFPRSDLYQGGLIRLHSSGPANKSGAGQTLISGNVIVNDLKNRPRNINIEGGRDVKISGNKLRNTAIHTKNGSGELVLTENDFTMTLAHSGAWINLAENLKSAILENNVFRGQRGSIALSPTEMLIRAETNNKGEGTRERIIENNIMEGFTQAIVARASAGVTRKGQMAPDVKPDRYLIRRNITDGKIRLEGLAASRLAAISGNFNMMTLQAMDAEIVDSVPEKLPEPVHTQEDDAADLSLGERVNTE